MFYFYEKCVCLSLKYAELNLKRKKAEHETNVYYRLHMQMCIILLDTGQADEKLLFVPAAWLIRTGDTDTGMIGK